MEQKDPAISSTQIGLGIELWSIVHMIRESKEPLFDIDDPICLPADEVEERLGISKEQQDRIINKAINLVKTLNEKVL